MIDVHGRFISVGMPDGVGQGVESQDLAFNGVLVGASHSGGRKETLDMLQLATDKGIKRCVQVVQISEEDLSHRTDVRYSLYAYGIREGFGEWGLGGLYIIARMVGSLLLLLNT